MQIQILGWTLEASLRRTDWEADVVKRVNKTVKIAPNGVGSRLERIRAIRTPDISKLFPEEQYYISENNVPCVGLAYANEFVKAHWA